MYSSGVYKRTNLADRAPVGHQAGKQNIFQIKFTKKKSVQAVRIVGWGVEGGNEFWRVANSWGDGWGEDGVIKILRGRNEAGIEDFHSNGI